MSTAKVNVCWIISLLSVALVVSLSIRFADIDGIQDKISIIATALSLVLSILAIIYAFIANSSLSSSVGSVKQAGDQISRDAASLQTAADGMGREVQTLPRHIENLQQKVEASLNSSGQTMKTTTEQLHAVVSQISAATHGLSASAESLKSQYAALPGLLDGLGGRIDQRLSQTETLLRERQAAPTTPIVRADEPRDALTDARVRRFLESSSLHGLMLLTAISAFLDKKKGEMDLKALSAAIGQRLDTTYVYGFAVATSAMDLIDGSMSESKFDIRFVHPVIKAEARPTLMRRVSVGKGGFKDEYTESLRKLDVFLAS